MDAPAATTLYPNGRGRRGPLPTGRDFKPGERVPLPGIENYEGTDLNKEAMNLWLHLDLSDPSKLPTQLREALGARKKKHSPRCKGAIPIEHVELRKRPRKDFLEAKGRFFAFIAGNFSWRTLECGIYIHGEVVPFRRNQLAERMDSPFRWDDKDRLRCPQLQRIFSDAKASDCVVVIEQRAEDPITGELKSRPALVKVTQRFLELSGVREMRDAWMLAEEQKAEAQKRQDRESEQQRLRAARKRAVEEWRANQAQRLEALGRELAAGNAAAAWKIRKITKQLERRARADYGPNAPPPSPDRPPGSRPPRPKPPT